MNGRQAHRSGTFALSLLMAAVGIALMVQAVTGAGLLSPRLLLGLLFIAAGALRIYLEIRKGRDA
jgi:uncharacterized membrane protein HdeD (DUF308 family)